MLPVPVGLVALLSRSRPVVSHVFDAKEQDRLLCKVEEALKGSYGLALSLSKVTATVLGSKHKGSQEEMDTVVGEQESRLEHIAINGALPGLSTAIGVHALKNVIQSF